MPPQSILRTALGAVLLLAITGCEIGPSLGKRLQAYIGQPETVLVQGLGIPSRAITSGGIKFVAYDWQSSTVIPGDPGFVGGGFVGGGGGWFGPPSFGPPGFGEWGGGWAAPPVVVTSGCEATFQMSPADTVAGFTLRGNACR